MRKVLVGLATLSVAAGAALALPGTAVASTPLTQAPIGTADQSAQGTDDLSSPMQDKARALRDEAVTQVLNGDATVTTKNGSRVVKLAGKKGKKDDRYVELAREQTDRVFVVLAEFGNERHPSYPDQDTSATIAGPATFEGPVHNKIPQPAKNDNSTVWQADYSKKHYEDLYFGEGKGVESLKTYYETQSSGRYSVDGTVTDWVKLPYNEARYGRSNGYPCSGNVCSNTWVMIADALQAWVADQQAKGVSAAEIKSTVASFDQWDRYDFDGDGNFNESDGYIDHFQIVHAGGDQADGDPQQGEDAIWSHRWYAYSNGAGTTGPANNKLGGTQIGDTGLWVGDYTTQPENGGLSVFAHEYGHDLGLPDNYDTASGGSSPVEYWSLMAQSRLNGKGEALGTRPGDIGAWEKLQLGWLDYEGVTATTAGKKKTRTIDLGPAEYNTKKPQATVVVLPKKQVTKELAQPASGEYEWYSDTGNDLSSTLTRSVALPAGSPQLTFQANWNIEDCEADACDYAYVDIDDGSGFTPIAGSITKATEGNGIDGVSDGWQPATFDLSAYAGKTVSLRFRYSTDTAAQGADDTLPAGIFLDDIKVAAGGTTVFEDGAETADNAWTASGFRRTTGTDVVEYDHYYIAAHRSYVSYDKYLETGPYNFGWPSTKPDYVEHFPYQEGLLVTYWDTSFSDNNVSVHPGEGRNLTVDAHPAPLYQVTGTPWRTRVQLYDAPFGLKKADSLTLHVDGVKSPIKGLKGNPLFDDTKNFYDTVVPDHGVKVAKAGVKIEVQKVKGTSLTVKVTS
ncbi:immune inhibitor A domain-containing protein [Kineosporia sp. NBRC 101731]|uniref:immune inhibitor A domain-containing protein n=1 Tax=Kineosporia sp. NBRC 101731 TaxID=3032199 RepID=UPI0024A58BD5|nr:immune inhibitor A domain-containing protein [Kineosporia sp. NBRC 101731]GLY31449.1 protease [Kineosporia sp. NBRC 101731]